MARFRKVEMSIHRANGYGHYIIKANYRGKDISVSTIDSEAFDYLERPENKIKHLEAKRHCYGKIVRAYELEKYNKGIFTNKLVEKDSRCWVRIP